MIIRKKYLKSLKRQQGVVIIIALFIVGLVAGMSYLMMTRLERDTRRTSLMLHAMQAENYAQGSISWAIDQLKNNWEQKKQTKQNNPVDLLPIVAPSINMNGYKIRSTIFDAQDRFNLNNISDEEGRKTFKRLLKLVDPEMKEDKKEEITGALLDWISIGGKNAYSKYYLELPTPYSPAHKLMIHANELLLVKGITPQLFLALKPHIIALPDRTPINIMNAKATILASLSELATIETGRALERARKEKPFLTVDDFLKNDIAKNFKISKEQLETTSDFFVVETEVTIDTQHVVLYTLLKRSKNDSKADVTIQWQSKNTF